MKTKPKISAVRVPLVGFIAQIYVDTLSQWFDMSGSPIFKTPEGALNWASDQMTGWPTESVYCDDLVDGGAP